MAVSTSILAIVLSAFGILYVIIRNAIDNAERRRVADRTEVMHRLEHFKEVDKQLEAIQMKVSHLEGYKQRTAEQENRA
jgi:hypothetical protein